MKKINLILIIILLTSSLSSNSQFTVSSGTTVTWNSPLTIYGNIYIEDGGKLIVNTDLTLLPNVRIYVHNGGILEGTNGSFVKHPSSSMANWGGVYVEGTNEIGGSIGTNAIDLENFLISGAKIAIYTYDYELGVSPITTNVVQQIQCKNVTFLNNDRHLLVENYGAYAINETSPNEFVGCTFGAATSSWPIMMFSPDGFSFRNSEFDYDSPFAQRAIHCDYPANLELINNEFYDVGWAAIGLHYTVENVTIHSNYFSTETQHNIIQDFDYAYTAIELGAEVPTTLKNITLSNNFIGDFSSVNTDNYVGIVMRNATGEDINITGNTMTGIGTGIDVKNMSLGNNLIRSNTISEGDYGVVAS
ncbi:MAG: hypothetical protein MI810_03020, partial [Flavobacteriales bacterium]|nr:hypothetical protein [Flavobacteriales bacterium]